MLRPCFFGQVYRIVENHAKRLASTGDKSLMSTSSGIGTISHGLPVVSVCKRWMGYYPGPKTPPATPNFDYSGDVDRTLPPLDMNLPRVEYEDSQQLPSADDITRQLLSLQFAPCGEVLKYRVNEIVKKVQKHELDYSSRGVIIAKQTMEIRNSIRHIMDFPKDKVNKSRLVNKIQKRRKQIKLLRQEDFPFYEKLIEFLKIDYVPVYTHTKPTKRERRVDEVIQKAVTLRQQKMEALRKALQQEKDVFVKQKELLLNEIEQEMLVIEEEENKLLDLVEDVASTPLMNKPHVGESLK